MFAIASVVDVSDVPQLLFVMTDEFSMKVSKITSRIGV